MSSPNVILINGAICLIGCAVAAVLGYWARKGRSGRPLKAVIVSVCLSWTLVAGLESFAVLPSVIVIGLVYPIRNADSSKDWPELRAHYISENRYTLGLSSLTLVATFGTYWYFSRKPKPSAGRGL